MFEVRFESADGARWRIGWWLATVGAWLVVIGVVGAVVAPQVSRNDSDGIIFFGVGLIAATVGFVALVIGRNLMFRRIVTQVADDGDDSSSSSRS
jgi:protein-S-isoprenylcysteine O-methyltransferase Ste14